MRFSPGAVLPDHEHVKIEQTYVLEGRLVDKEGAAAGLEVGPGEFVWREPGSRHVACCPDGGLMLAMFQIPNKFHERDGRVTDLSGQDWRRRGARCWGSERGQGAPKQSGAIRRHPGRREAPIRDPVPPGARDTDRPRRTGFRLSPLTRLGRNDGGRAWRTRLRREAEIPV
jgi:ChrR Cupin-like domain